MNESNVLSSAIKDRGAYERIETHVETEDLSEQGWVVWDAVQSYYRKDPDAKRCDPELLARSISRKLSSDKHRRVFNDLVLSLAERDTSVSNVVDDLLATKRAAVGQMLANSLLSGQKPNGLLDKYRTLQEAEDLTSEEEETRVGFSVLDLVAERFGEDNLIAVSPSSLNRRLEGGLKPGHHVVLFARPEMGKTAMTIEMMAGFLAQDLKVLYIGNEDPIDDINMRVINRLAGMDKKEVLESPEKADLRARESGYERLFLASLAPGTPYEIERLIEAHKPHVLVIDQLRNLNMGEDNFVLSLEMAATKAREWAKRHQLVVVSVTQAGDSASGKATLDLGDVDYSNTGIPAQADVMIGLGANDKNKMRGEVVVSLPKNKVSGNHEWFTLVIHPHLSRLEGID